MNVSAQIATHFRAVHFGGNWTDVNLKDTLADVTWKQATRQVESFNTIASLVYHIHYFVAVVIKVLEGGPLVGNDAVSFDHPLIESKKDWDQFLDKTWTDAKTFARLLDKLPEHKLWENLGDEKYGSYYRNIHGIIEHTHYHLGQIILVKKMILQETKN